MQAVGQRFRKAGVAAIYLVHGTFVGNDAFGLIRKIARIVPAAGDQLRQLNKYLLDAVVGDVGNYTSEFAEEFEQAINVDSEITIPVRLFHWSSENHHIGRADGAVRLIGELMTHEWSPQQRVLLWGHSHGGNVLALVSNLLSGDRTCRAKFFHAARPYYRLPLIGWIDVPVWEHVRCKLGAPGNPFNVHLDFATFGTPVRYGWDSAGYSQLASFVYHRPTDGLPDYQTTLPDSIDEVLSAAAGDYVQHFAIAGTNIGPGLFAWRTRWADRRLNRFLQPTLRKRDLLSRLKLGIRAPEEGTTLLVDYGPVERHIGQHHAGHAIYTRTQWLLFHAEEIASRFYGEPSEQTHD